LDGFRLFGNYTRPGGATELRTDRRPGGSPDRALRFVLSGSASWPRRSVPGQDRFLVLTILRNNGFLSVGKRPFFGMLSLTRGDLCVTVAGKYSFSLQPRLSWNRGRRLCLATAWNQTSARGTLRRIIVARRELSSLCRHTSPATLVLLLL
jgi:hypothetical protein